MPIPLGAFYSLTGAGIAGTWFYRVVNYMSNAVVKAELHQDGTKVTLHYKTGKKVDANIRDLYKHQHEKTLLETFEEPFLFPVSHKGKQFFFNGDGQEAIKHGEVFRAVINGKSIKL
mmetsp:Transcript_17177/g.15172  ORF Transcript_17177/g.15172 Transcript_17177/m.15172 type:complete len:117 (+) Transcript_17177:252-602(+)